MSANIDKPTIETLLYPASFKHWLSSKGNNHYSLYLYDFPEIQVTCTDLIEAVNNAVSSLKRLEAAKAAKGENMPEPKNPIHGDIMIGIKVFR